MSSQLETGSLVQFGNPVQYGVIKRIETGIAEVETVRYMDTILFCNYVAICNSLVPTYTYTILL